jgi:hypothetical protein
VLIRESTESDEMEGRGGGDWEVTGRTNTFYKLRYSRPVYDAYNDDRTGS